MPTSNEKLEEIRADINHRMEQYHSSLEPTDDEVSIAWLVAEVDRLTRKGKSLDKHCKAFDDCLTTLARKIQDSDARRLATMPLDTEQAIIEVFDGLLAEREQYRAVAKLKQNKPEAWSGFLGQGLCDAAQGVDMFSARTYIEAGADVDWQDKEGMTPLLWAVAQADPVMARLLVGKGADPDIRDKQFRTPLSLALRLGHIELVTLLIAAGAETRSAEGHPHWAGLRERGGDRFEKALQNGRALRKSQETDNEILDNLRLWDDARLRTNFPNLFSCQIDQESLRKIVNNQIALGNTDFCGIIDGLKHAEWEYENGTMKNGKGEDVVAKGPQYVNIYVYSALFRNGTYRTPPSYAENTERTEEAPRP